MSSSLLTHSITHNMTRVTQVKEETYANVKSMTGKLDTQIVPVITGFIGRPVILDSWKAMILFVFLFLPSLSQFSFPPSLHSPFLTSSIYNATLFTCCYCALSLYLQISLLPTRYLLLTLPFLTFLPFPLSYLRSLLPNRLRRTPSENVPFREDSQTRKLRQLVIKWDLIWPATSIRWIQE